MRIDKLLEEAGSARAMADMLLKMDDKHGKPKHSDDILVHTYVVPVHWRKCAVTRLQRKHLRLVNKRQG